MSVDINPEVTHLSRSFLDSAREEKPFLNELPAEVQHLFADLTSFAQILWSPQGYTARLWVDGNPAQVCLKGEDGFKFAIDHVVGFQGKYSMGVRRCFSDCPETYKEPERFEMVIQLPHMRTVQKTNNYAALVHDKGMTIIQFKPWRLYRFERIEDTSDFSYGLMEVRSEFVDSESLLHYLHEFRSSCDFQDFNEEGRRKVGALIKYLEAHSDDGSEQNITR